MSVGQNAEADEEFLCDYFLEKKEGADGQPMCCPKRLSLSSLSPTRQKKPFTNNTPKKQTYMDSRKTSETAVPLVFRLHSGTATCCVFAPFLLPAVVCGRGSGEVVASSNSGKPLVLPIVRLQSSLPRLHLHRWRPFSRFHHHHHRCCCSRTNHRIWGARGCPSLLCEGQALCPVN